MKGKQYPIAQCTPISSRVLDWGDRLRRVAGHRRDADGCQRNLAQHSPLVNNGEGPVLPELKDIQTVSRAIAFAVGKVARARRGGENLRRSAAASDQR